MTTIPTRTAPPAAIRSGLKAYRVLAMVAGVALFILLLEMFLKYVLKQTNLLTEFWSPVHGLIYFAFAVSIANLGLKSRWPMGRIVLNLLSGFVPFVPFVAERRVTRSTKALLVGLEDGPGASGVSGQTPAGR
ncbi:MAG: DUF3817 domain-containing protein [Actinomycetota bacterium]|nr:DUF3817 domain-containing protein [Actinomycetota bacterium]